jgi:hypothetical protein
LAGGYLDIVCLLAISPNEGIASNALWAIKNLLFNSPDPLKVQVMETLSWENLKQ